MSEGTAGSRASWERQKEGPSPEREVEGYTPLTDSVRLAYIADRLPKVWAVEDAESEFDSWLAEHDRRVLETVLGPLRHILSSGYGCADCAYEDLREVARMEGLEVHSEHI